MSCNFAVCVNPQEGEEQNRESQERRTTIAEEWQRNSNDWNKTDYHANIYGKVKEEYRCKGVSVGSSKPVLLSFGKCYETQDKYYKECQYKC